MALIFKLIIQLHMFTQIPTRMRISHIQPFIKLFLNLIRLHLDSHSFVKKTSKPTLTRIIFIPIFNRVEI